MADALVSVVLERLSSIIAQKVQKEVGLVAGVKHKVQKLQSNFQAIQVVLADAERRQLKEESIKRWTGQLKDVSSMNAALPDLIANLSCLRTLKLRGCGIKKVSSNIGKLIHLRHVDLSFNEIKELPEEMCELYNMQTLDVSDCSEVLKLPDNIGKLIKLRYLRVGNEFVKMRGFEGLGCLRELDEFHVRGSGEGSNIGGLKNLNHLQGYLRIKWLGDVNDPDEVKKTELKSKKNLAGLDLWFGPRTKRRIIRDDEILEALEPPPNNDSLVIGDYQGILHVLPSWFDKLKDVRLEDWGKMENLLPPLGSCLFLKN